MGSTLYFCAQDFEHSNNAWFLLTRPLLRPQDCATDQALPLPAAPGHHLAHARARLLRPGPLRRRAHHHLLGLLLPRLPGLRPGGCGVQGSGALLPDLLQYACFPGRPRQRSFEPVVARLAPGAQVGERGSRHRQLSCSFLLAFQDSSYMDVFYNLPSPLNYPGMYAARKCGPGCRAPPRCSLTLCRAARDDILLGLCDAHDDFHGQLCPRHHR